MKENKKNYNKIKFIGFLCIIGLALFLLYENRETLMNLKIEKVLQFIEERGAFAALIYLGIYIVKPFFLIIPTNIIAIAGGMMFGPVKGFILTMVGFFITGTIAFFVSRMLGRDFVEGLLGKKMLKLDENLEKNGFKILFLLRLPPILPYDPLSYACGFTKVKYSSFIVASLLGVMPETICYSILGKNMDKPFSPEFIIPIILLVVGLIFSKKIISKKNKFSEKKQA
ncbi:TVP38/TMEM64 family protein [uncultured Clostridium sp.]|uniref:TVP38/TMEM64 family protein n=1 Tax=uncultured Clostridium sp. TaxID=59620 RepID=UPI0026386785|nr:TVP38/TMEM64 family protein [uncultured Clostridium sp.]